MDCQVAASMVLTLLCGVSDEWAEELLQFLAAAGLTFHFASLMLSQRHHNQRFLPAIQALVVVHRHGAPPFDNQPTIMRG